MAELVIGKIVRANVRSLRGRSLEGRAPTVSAPSVDAPALFADRIVRNVLAVYLRTTADHIDESARLSDVGILGKTFRTEVLAVILRGFGITVPAALDLDQPELRARLSVMVSAADGFDPIIADLIDLAKLVAVEARRSPT